MLSTATLPYTKTNIFTCIIVEKNYFFKGGRLPTNISVYHLTTVKTCHQKVSSNFKWTLVALELTQFIDQMQFFQ